MKQFIVGIAALLWVAAAGCSGATPPEQLRLDAPAEAGQVVHLGRLTDAYRSFERNAWNLDRGPTSAEAVPT